jgi:putative cardiolipin synthase
MGIIVDSPALAQAVQKFFDTATSPANAYRVSLVATGLRHTGRMQWQTSDDGKTVTYVHDPDATMKRRLEVDLIRWLPIRGVL